MRILKRLAVPALMLAVPTAVAAESGQKTEPPGLFDRVTYHKQPGDEKVKVYTNADLEKMFGIVDEQDREPAAAEDGAEAPKTAEGATPAEAPQQAELPDPLVWLAQRQAAQERHRADVAAAEQALADAKKRLSELETLLLATRNPFSARPQLSDAEKKERAATGETAAERYERTSKLVDDAREAVRVAEAELSKVRAEQP